MSTEAMLPDEETDWRIYNESDRPDVRISARNRLVEQYMPIVKSCAIRMSKKSSIPIDDLMSEGYPALIWAVEQFNPNKNTKFITFAWTCIYRTMINRAKSTTAQKNTRSHIPYGIEDTIADDQAASPDARLTSESTARQILSLCRPDERLLLSMYYFDRKHLKECGAALGMSFQMASLRIKAALTRLRTEPSLQDLGYEFRQPKEKTMKRPRIIALHIGEAAGKINIPHVIAPHDLDIARVRQQWSEWKDAVYIPALTAYTNLPKKEQKTTEPPTPMNFVDWLIKKCNCREAEWEDVERFVVE